MGHWSESKDLLEEARQRIAGGPGRPQPTLDELAPYLREAAREIELLAGRTFSPPRTATRFFESDGLPFIEVPDFLLGSESELAPDVYPIPDPVRPTIAVAFQTGRWPAEERVKPALPTSEALWWAGHALHRWHTEERFDQDFAMVRYTDRARAAGGPDNLDPEFGRRLLNPDAYVHLAIGSAQLPGWFLQVTRRVRAVTRDTPDDARLMQLLGHEGPVGIVAEEPRVVLARITEEPADWAIVLRLWKDVARVEAAPWRLSGLSKAIHGHGVPIISLDQRTTAPEIAVQMVLRAYWHGYLDGNDPGLAGALQSAFPRQVKTIREGTHSPDDASAAAKLLERLLSPGFDPARGVEGMRRYIWRHARTIILAHRQELRTSRPWVDLGISERYYYRLLTKFVTKAADGRYVVDEEVMKRLAQYLELTTADRERRANSIEFLLGRGFTLFAARKWLQRNPIEAIGSAWPRGAKRDRWC